MKIHTGGNPCICSVCDKSFIRAEHLFRHMKIHTGEKLFKCSECTKSFFEPGNWKTHMRIHTGEKPYSCTTCAKSFILAGDLTRHMRIHTGEKPYRCSECTKSFTRSCSLKRHMMRMHTWERMYPCPPPIPSQVENETDFCHVAEMTMYIIINKNKTINGTGTNFIFKFIYTNST